MKNEIIPLTDKESKDLVALEFTVKVHKDSAEKMFAALSEIKHRELWRGGHKSWKDYCGSRWGWGESYIVKLTQSINFAESKALIRDTTGEVSDVPKTVGSARSMMRSEKSNREIDKSPDTVLPVIEPPINNKNGSSTKTKDHARDATGKIIPSKALPFWNRRQEIQDLMTRVSELKCEIKAKRDSQDPLYVRFNQQSIAGLEKAHYHLGLLKPYAVCTKCQGDPNLNGDGCDMCGTTGLICEEFFKTASRKEIVDMRIAEQSMRK